MLLNKNCPEHKPPKTRDTKKQNPPVWGIADSVTKKIKIMVYKFTLAIKKVPATALCFQLFLIIRNILSFFY